MKVLIFGAGGQVGRALRALALEDVHLTTVDNDALDLCNAAQIAPFIRNAAPDVIINAAGYTAVDKAESEPALAYAINGEAPGEMARAAAALGARFLHISTDFVFDGTACLPYAASSSVNPVSVYGASKAAGEFGRVSKRQSRAILDRDERRYVAEWPVNADAGVVPRQTDLVRRRVKLGTFVKEVGAVLQRQKSVRKAWRHPKHAVVLR